MNQSALLERTSKAAMRWYALAWDSEQYGFPAARLEIDVADEAGLDGILSECRESGIRHLITRIDAGSAATIHLLERSGFSLLDGLQIFTVCLEVGPSIISRADVTIRTLTPEDVPQVLAIARSSYVHDHFHVDASLPAGIADRINEKWVENCCNGAMADVVYIAEHQDEILGFVTASVGKRDAVGKIGMVAVLASWRGRGVARAITAQVLQWMRRRGMEEASVGTQLANIAAARLYQSFGFRTSAVHLTYRKII